MKRFFVPLGFALLLTAALPCSASWLDKLGLGRKDTNATGSAVGALSSIPLSQEQMVAGLKEALNKGLAQAVNGLGRSNGFLTNVNVRIPMPEKLQTVEKTLRTFKQDQLADNFVTTMNRAAEQAVPAALNVFTTALTQMTIADAKSILTGKTNEATQFFQRVTRTNLYGQFLPIVKKATEANQVTASYKNLLAKSQQYGLNEKASALGSLLNRSGATTNSLDVANVDLDAYVTEKALDGLFKMVADEEKKIRENPAARTTDLLQKVFGSLQK